MTETALNYLEITLGNLLGGLRKTTKALSQESARDSKRQSSEYD
jgi:hypothetical protein